MHIEKVQLENDIDLTPTILLLGGKEILERRLMA